MELRLPWKGIQMRIVLPLALILCLALATASPSAARSEAGPSGGPVKACADGLDNDADGLTDYPADPDCGSANGNSEQSDESTAAALCRDGLDNDADGKTDYPADPGCAGATDNDETDRPPYCSDGLDNDGDGKTDYPADPGCTSTADDDETDVADSGTTASATSATPPPDPAPAAVAAPIAAAPVVAPRLLTPFPIVRLRGVLSPAGITIGVLSVRAPSGTAVELRCRGERCPYVRKRIISAGSTVRFRGLGGRALFAVTLEVRATKRGYVGKFTRFRLRQGRFPLRSDACLAPGRSTPSACE
jgi:hypothetical protein